MTYTLTDVLATARVLALALDSDAVSRGLLPMLDRIAASMRETSVPTGWHVRRLLRVLGSLERIAASRYGELERAARGVGR